jgi:hypothetical protein
MAIVINGSGSITGISAGGLPDSSVTADDIASGAVTATKLADTLDLTGKTVTLPSGSVTADDIASGAVNATKLADTLDLSDKTLTLPAGSVTPTTDDVLTAYAGASLGALGTYGGFVYYTTTAYAAGATTSGSNLYWAGAGVSYYDSATYSGSPSGTWRLLGYRYAASAAYGTAVVGCLNVWLRIA